MIDNEATIIEPPKVSKEIRPGTLLLNTYLVERSLGEGGMALTYLTHHKELSNTKHVIKVMRTELSKDLADTFSLTNAEATNKAIDLLKREAEALISISHQAIVGYQGFQKDENHGYCLVMEYVEGPSLKDLLRQRRLNVFEVLQLRNRLAEGLAAAHGKGIFHRDISPDNIILSDGKVTEAKLIDFGIAKRNNSAAGTVFGPVFVGKYAYAAPEQLGMYNATVNAYSDIYSLGLVLAEALLGKRLDMGSSEESARQARRAVPDLGKIPTELKAQFKAMLQPNPVDRVQSMALLLQNWPYPPNKRINKWVLLSGGLALVALVVGVILWTPAKKILKLENTVTPANSNLGYGYLTVNSTPEGALVLANDNHTFIGITPISKAYISAGTNKLLIKMKGYQAIEKPITIKPKLQQKLTIELQADRMGD